jgi:nicotinamidase/pyrazinamidase
LRPRHGRRGNRQGHRYPARRANHPPAFLEADKETKTGLASYLKERRIDTIFVTGLGTDFCVAWTAIDGRHAGFNVYVVDDACRGIDINGWPAAAWNDRRRRQEDRVRRHRLTSARRCEPTDPRDFGQ